ncbi:MAG: Aminopeptidase [Bacteroidota bacterium]|nr:Aminopeptidase [Bacteroidota bacterium]
MMKRIGTITAMLLFALAINVKSQDLPYYFLPNGINEIEFKNFTCSYYKTEQKRMRLLANVLPQQPYDALSYDIYLDLYDMFSKPDVPNRSPYFTAINNIKVRLDSVNIKEISFDCVSLTVDSVFLNNQKTQSKTSSGKLIIGLNPDTNQGDTVSIDVYYTSSGLNNGGFYYFPKGTYVGLDYKKDTVATLERIAYTQGEPDLSRYWYPCNDVPNDKVKASVTIKVPNGITAASNGLLKEVENIDNYTVFHWADTSQIATYLIAVAASKYKVVTDSSARVSDTTKKIPIYYYVWDQDYQNTATDGTQYNPQYSLRNTSLHLKLLSQIFFEYPFEKYSIAAVHPFYYGGMENQTMTICNRSWLRGTAETGFFHELAHHWLGDYVTCATWSDIWFNEGGASWCEAMYYYEIGGSDYYDTYMNWLGNSYIKERWLFETPIANVAVDDIFGNYATLTYKKASWIYNMLYQWLGRDEFLAALRQTLRQHAFGNISTEDFIASLEELVPNPPIQIRDFFDQWFYHAGHPKFEVESGSFRNPDNSFRIVCHISQVQIGMNVPKVFTAPLTLLCYKNDTALASVNVLDTAKDQNFYFNLDFRPDSIIVDNRRILCEQTSFPTGVEQYDYSAENIDIIPSLISSGNSAILKIEMNKAAGVTAVLYDILGSRIKYLYEGRLEPGEYNFGISTAGLAAGVYFVNVEIGARAISKAVVIE